MDDYIMNLTCEEYYYYDEDWDDYDHSIRHTVTTSSAFDMDDDW